MTVNNDRYLANHPTITLIDQCSKPNQLKQIHAQMLRTGLFSDPFSASKLISAVALSSSPNLNYARQIFDEIPHRNLYTWNALIRAYASSGEPHQSLLIFIRMLHDSNDLPNKFTFPFVLKAAAELEASWVGSGVHGMVVKGSLGADVFILNSLIHFYAKCGSLDMAYRVFSNISRRDVVSWNSMITAFAQGDCVEEALELFRGMLTENIKANCVTMVGVLSACAKKLDLEYGRWAHSYIERNEIDESLTLNNVMLDMYSKCGSVEDARRLFDKMAEKDIVSWTTMLFGYAKLGAYGEARRVFDAMPRQDIAAWNALISAYEQSGNPREALATFNELQLKNNVKPDEVTLVSSLSACSQLGAMDLGGWIHVYVKRQGIKLNCHLTTSLIDMYSKCGDLEKALEVFYSVDRRDVFVWSAMIAGLAMHGRGKDAINLFMQMQEAKVKPNAVTFTNLLCACSHTGLVEEGTAFFNQMELDYGVVPGTKHYACMVDILGRAGRLEEAMEFIEKMPIAPGASIWGALLGACRIRGNVNLAEQACSRLLELEPRNHGAYVLLSNIYAKSGKWDKVSWLRKLMRDCGLKKEPGCSSIEVSGIVHEFLVGDSSHPLSKDIYSKVDEIASKLKSVGYVPNKSHLLQLVEEEDAQDQALYLHSEKLAIAFGLIRLTPSQPIRIVKNLRVCGDCHTVAKLISKLYDREILLRDRYRFHHFRGGICSSALPTGVNEMDKLALLAFKYDRKPQLPKVINLGNNSFTGQIPKEICRLHRLQFLRLAYNSFEGEIPTNLYNCSDLGIIDLSNNILQGEISPELEFLNLGFNELNGEIPHEIGRLLQLKYLYLHFNNLTGEIPHEIGRLLRLRYLNLQANSLLGWASSNSSHTLDLQSINLAFNLLSGDAPIQVCLASKLKRLDISYNSLDGVIPECYGNSSKYLILLNLGNNRLHGTIPDTFPEGNGLMSIDFESNYLHGPVPRSWAHSRYLEILNLRNNKLSGTFPYWLEALPNLHVLALRSNRLQGEIPESLGDLISLRLLNISNNSLTGQIPSSLGNMAGLESLDLSANLLVGTIPMQLTSCTFLAVLNLSKNNLVGPIPRGNQFNTFGNDSYAENLALCGFPLSEPCTADEAPKRPPGIFQQSDGSFFLSELSWEVVALGYGFGFIIGVVIGYLAFLTGKPKWFVGIVEGNKRRKKRDINWHQQRFSRR
ncbi:hypothetical protein RJ640_015264 [Escallonia rubra]|uniref:DYW domain-containing protein n=1 Tax=Escallonia rubra TaxID=112253 RepID=A0AA88QKU5_9ASTE|nr:hypothetical protein RJ640_015264 [Escallonia rubra]